MDDKARLNQALHATVMDQLQALLNAHVRIASLEEALADLQKKLTEASNESKSRPVAYPSPESEQEPG